MKRYVSSAASKPARILRMGEARKRLGNLGETAFEENFIKNGRLKKLRFGRRACGVLESNVDEVIAEIAAAAEGETE